HAIDDLTGEPASAGGSEQLLLNMVASEADTNRQASVDLIRWTPDKLLDEARKLTQGPTLFAPAHHEVLPENVNLHRLDKIVRSAHESGPQDYVSLLGAKGVGPATVRALSLLAELIYDAPASHRDPLEATKLPPVLSKRSWAD